MTFAKNISAVDLFCGAGGLTKGLEKSGIQVNLGVDLDSACQFPYTANNSAEFLLASVGDITGKDIINYFEKNSVKLLAGCAPCQTFSTYNRKSDDSDKRWWLLREFSRLIGEVEPELVTMENVPGLINQDVFQEFVTTLKAQDYFVNYKIIDCSDYGLPQSRKRLVLLASRFGDIPLLKPRQFTSKTSKTVKDAIGGLPKIEAGSYDKKDKLHKAASLSELNYKRIKASKPGGTWRDWPNELVADCHKKKSGATYSSVYGRMVWDKPAPAMTTQFTGFGNGRFGHPEQDRAISLREGAILQGFPKNYKFVPNGQEVQTRTISRLVGNAVPVNLGRLIGKSIIKHLEKYNGR